LKIRFEQFADFDGHYFTLLQISILKTP
jgi:hypothetical protein